MANILPNSNFQKKNPIILMFIELNDEIQNI